MYLLLIFDCRLSGAEINEHTNNPMVASDVEALQKAWDDLNDLLEEKEEDLKVGKLSSICSIWSLAAGELYNHHNHSVL